MNIPGASLQISLMRYAVRLGRGGGCTGTRHGKQVASLEKGVGTERCGRRGNEGVNALRLACPFASAHSLPAQLEL